MCFACMYACVYLVHRGQKKVLDPLGLCTYRWFVSYHVGDGNQTQDLSKSSRNSYPLGLQPGALQPADSEL